MEAVFAKVKSLLAREFAGSEVDLEVTGHERIAGTIFWTGFAGMDQIERQRRLWAVLRANLTRDEQLCVSAILTLTPEELSAARAG